MPTLGLICAASIIYKSGECSLLVSGAWLNTEACQVYCQVKNHTSCLWKLKHLYLASSTENLNGPTVKSGTDQQYNSIFNWSLFKKHIYKAV